MKRLLSLIAASAALGLAASAYAAPPEDSGAAQAPSAEQTPAPPQPDNPATAPASGSTSSDAAAQSGTSDSTATSSASASKGGDAQTVPAPGGQSSNGPDNTRLAAITPSGMSPQEACAGFQNNTDCAATLHVAQNLNIPFADLKAKLASGEKIDAAIKEMKPDADAEAELMKAVKQAREDAGSPPSG